jgi:hypothetical protein
MLTLDPVVQVGAPAGLDDEQLGLVHQCPAELIVEFPTAFEIL